jgi:hypothetical protein
VVNPRAALLSNYEVLSLLRELESDNLLRTKAALRIKKEEEAANGAGNSMPPAGNPHLEASENLRTIEVEVRSLPPWHPKVITQQWSYALGHRISFS